MPRAEPVAEREHFEWAAVIEGEAAAKANSRRHVVRVSRQGRGYISSIKSAKALAFCAAAVTQLHPRRPPAPYTGDLEMECRIYYASRRPDLDESLVMDCLQRARVIGNDRQIKVKHVYWGLDPARPRVLVRLTPWRDGGAG